MPLRGTQSVMLSANKNKGKTPPPEETFEESSYLKWLGEKQKQVTIKLMDGELLRGWIEYYDKHMIRLTREGAPNLFIFKHEIMYIAEGVLKETKPRRGRVARTMAAAAASDNGSQSAETEQTTREPGEESAGK